MDWVAQTDKRTGKLDHRQTEQVWHRSKTVAGFGCTGWRLERGVFSSGFVTCRRKRVSSERQCLCAGSNPVPFPNDLEPCGMGLRCKRRSSRFDSERGLQRKACGMDEYTVLKTAGRKRLQGSIPWLSSNALVGANSMFALLESLESESRLAKGARLQHV
jgi:hypothetical protein